jgi:predicted Zn-ribbon and HTH transcriptional regulator
MSTTLGARNFIGKVRVSQHALDRAVDRLGIAAEKAEQWIRDNVKKAEFVSVITAEDGRLSRLFAFQRVAYIMPLDTDLVVTVYTQHYAPSEMQQKVQAVAKRELAKVYRKEKAIERKVRVEKSRLSVELAKCQYRMEITPSRSVISANNARVAEIQAQINVLDSELLSVQKEKSSIAKGLIAFL